MLAIPLALLAGGVQAEDAEQALHGITGSGVRGITGSGVRGITGSGVRGITGSGVRGITGSGVRGITGSGVRGITGSGVRGITGSGVRGITGSGVRGITGSGVRGITGSGVRGITGSGVRGITGSGVRGITGSGVRGITGSGVRAYQSVALGAVERILSEGETAVVTVLGQTYHVPAASVEGISVGDYVLAASDDEGNSSSIYTTGDQYIAGASPIMLVGRVTGVSAGTASLTIGGAVLDYSTLLTLAPDYVPAEGDLIEVHGIQPQLGGVILVGPVDGAPGTYVDVGSVTLTRAEETSVVSEAVSR